MIINSLRVVHQRKRLYHTHKQKQIEFQSHYRVTKFLLMSES